MFDTFVASKEHCKEKPYESGMYFAFFNFYLFLRFTSWYYSMPLILNEQFFFASAFKLLKCCWYGVSTYWSNRFILRWIDPSREFCISNPRKSLHILIYTWLSYSLRKQFLACHTCSAFGRSYLSSSTSPRNISCRYVLEHNIKTTIAGIDYMSFGKYNTFSSLHATYFQGRFCNKFNQIPFRGGYSLIIQS